jgi:hypothetical protein
VACGAQTELQILEAEKIPFVEQADSLEHFASNQRHAAADAIDGADPWRFECVQS